MQRRLAALVAMLLGLIVFGTGVSHGATTFIPPAEAEDLPTITVRVFDNRGLEEGESGEPVPDVEMEVLDADGSWVAEGVTNDEGIAVIEVPAAAVFTVVVDTDTLPEGAVVEDDDGVVNNERIARIIGSNAFISFNLDDGDGAVGNTVTQRTINGVVSGIKFGLIIALAALGLSMVFGTTGLTNFSHGDLITFGALVTYGFNRGLGLPVIASAFLAVGVSGLFGWAQERGLWRPLRKRGTGLIAMMIVSIGFALFLRNIYQYVFGGTTKSLTQYTSQPRQSYGPISLAPKEIAIIVVALIAIAIVCVALMKTRLGKATRAVSDNPALSASSGLRVDGVIAAVWIVGTALTGLAGALLAVDQQVEFQIGYKFLLLVFASVTLGGLGTIWGALFGSLVVGILVEVSPVFGVPSELKYTPALFALIIILLVRPQGLLGRRERIG